MMKGNQLASYQPTKFNSYLTAVIGVYTLKHASRAPQLLPGKV